MKDLSNNICKYQQAHEKSARHHQSLCVSHSDVSGSVTPRTLAHQTPLSMEFSSKNAEVGSHSLLQGIFPTQGLNPGLPHCATQEALH